MLDDGSSTVRLENSQGRVSAFLSSDTIALAASVTSRFTLVQLPSFA